MIPVLIGYLAKRSVRRDQWSGSHPTGGFPAAPPVEEIASVSRCIAGPAEGWREFNRHNVHDLYDRPELAWSVVPEDQRAAFRLYAYRRYPVRFDDGHEEPAEELWDLTIEPIPRPFVRLGWDAVEGGPQSGLGCSPLSCNGLAALPGLPEPNRHCLASSRADAFALAREFSRSKPEPGPYCVIEVWRLPPETATA